LNCAEPTFELRPEFALAIACIYLNLAPKLQLKFGLLGYLDPKYTREKLRVKPTSRTVENFLSQKFTFTGSFSVALATSKNSSF
jgi:hypothetical protein